MASCLSGNGTLWKTDPALTVATSVFHIFLDHDSPLPAGTHRSFMAGILADGACSASLNPLSDGLTLDSDSVLRSLSSSYGRLFVRTGQARLHTIYDYVVLLIAIAPFLTGFFAYHQWFHYETAIAASYPLRRNHAHHDSLYQVRAHALFLFLPFLHRRGI